MTAAQAKTRLGGADIPTQGGNKHRSLSLGTSIQPLQVETPLDSCNKDAPPAPFAERRCGARIMVESLAYVGLGDENGGILLDINLSGFSVQTALPLEIGSARCCRARFTGIGDFEADCQPVWSQEGQTGCQFVNLSADLSTKLDQWIAANGIAPKKPNASVPQTSQNQLAASALCLLDEALLLLQNSKLARELK